MIAKLSTRLRREVMIEEQPYIVSLDEHGVTLVAKGRRKGLQLAWRDLVGGEAALSIALNASLQRASGRSAGTDAVARVAGRRKKGGTLSSDQ